MDFFLRMDQSQMKSKPTCIEDLPEELISTVVSNLKVRDVVRASLTCKQWLHLPALLSEITLDDSALGDDDDRVPRQPCREADQLFVNKVNKFLKLYQKLQLATGRRTPLLSFTVRRHLERFYSADIDSWVDFALTNRVKVLDVDVYGYMGVHMYVFPGDLLDKTASGIVLEKLSLSCDFERSLRTRLISLKELAFQGANLKEYDISNILASCPNLLNFSLTMCWLPETLIVRGKSLAHLRVKWCYCLKQIQLLDSSALTHFIYIGIHVSLIQFHGALKLTDVTFCIQCEDTDEYISQELHRHFPVMKSLLLFKLTQTHLNAESRIDFLPGTYQRLQTLKLCCHHESTLSLLSVLKMLRACPVPPAALEYSAKDDDVELPIQAFHDHLNSVQVSGFNGNEGHVKLVTLLIQAAAVLDQIIGEFLV
uniref:F-box domain-containing protein n=1 Tax=Kalanchoe fedtschenkoi TaxID=63787 RepID=A0A7N0UEE5_KALFE